MTANDGLCRLTRGWFCRAVFWRAERAAELAHLARLHAVLDRIDRDVHPDRPPAGSPARPGWDHDHARAA